MVYLPKDILQLIFTFLPTDEILLVSLTSKDWFKSTETDNFWNLICKRDGLEPKNSNKETKLYLVERLSKILLEGLGRIGICSYRRRRRRRRNSDSTSTDELNDENYCSRDIHFGQFDDEKEDHLYRKKRGNRRSGTLVIRHIGAQNSGKRKLVLNTCQDTFEYEYPSTRDQTWDNSFRALWLPKGGLSEFGIPKISKEKPECFKINIQMFTIGNDLVSDRWSMGKKSNNDFWGLWHYPIKKIDGALLCFDLTDRKTFEKLEKFCDQYLVNEIRMDEESDEKLLDRCVLVGCKCDMKDNIQVERAEIERLKEKLGVEYYFETSAKEDINVDEAHKTCILLALKYHIIEREDMFFFEEEEVRNYDDDEEKKEPEKIIRIKKDWFVNSSMKKLEKKKEKISGGSSWCVVM